MWRSCWALVLLVACAPADPSSSSDCGPTTMPSLSSVSDQHKAELSHRQHLEALFNRYGENGSISLAGLRRLLQNLGLDRIRNVTVQHHEKPGRHHHGNHRHHHHHHHHDHHGHNHTDHKQDKNQQPDSHGHNGHEHGDHSHDEHDHNDSHHDDHNHDHDAHNHDDHSHDHDDHSHDHDDHSHDHDDHSHDHDDHSHDHDDHSHDDHDHSLDDHNHDHVDHSRDDHDHNDHKHDHNHEHSNEAQDQSSDKPSQKLLDEAGTKMGKDEIEKNKVPESTTASSVRRVKREEPTSARSQSNPLQPHEGGSEQEDPVLDRSQCLNASTLLSSHGLSAEGGLTLGDFSLLCPSLLDQLDRGACIRHGTGSRHHHGNHNHTEHSDAPAIESRNVVTAWAGGFTSITIISLLSLLGVVLIPLMNKVFFNFLLSFLVALAVGTLSGDAFLHLIPHSLVGHHHSDEFHHGDHGDHGDHMDHGDDSMDGVWKGLTALGGVYFMFLIEHFLTLGKMYKDKKNKTQKKAELQDKEEQAVLKEDLLKNHEEVEAAVPAGVAEEEQVMLTPSVQVLSAQGYTEQDCENKCHSHFHDTVGQADHKHHHHHDYHHILHHHHSQNHHPHSHSHSHGMSRLQEGGGIASLAWMVVMGDGLHNFSDGLAIGAAFTQGLSSGLSTSVAVFCHELPHELGDFAVLLKAGMTVKQAIWYNVLSAMMAYLGMATGILIGHYAENVSMWIFALTAGLFMYVALVDMMPEMLHNDAGEHGFSHWGFFGLQNAGILLGFCIMLLIALFEHRIRLELGQ